MEFFHFVLGVLFFVFCTGLLVCGCAVIVRSIIWVIEKLFGI